MQLKLRKLEGQFVIDHLTIQICAPIAPLMFACRTLHHFILILIFLPPNQKCLQPFTHLLHSLISRHHYPLPSPWHHPVILAVSAVQCWSCRSCPEPGKCSILCIRYIKVYLTLYMNNILYNWFHQIWHSNAKIIYCSSSLLRSFRGTLINVPFNVQLCLTFRRWSWGRASGHSSPPWRNPRVPRSQNSEKCHLFL